MGIVSLADLITSAQQMSDLENNTFISQQEWINLINFGTKQYWNKINQTLQDYNIQENYFTLTQNQTDYPLPDATSSTGPYMYTRGIDAALAPTSMPPPQNTVWLPLLPYDFKERGSYQYPWFTNVGGIYALRYRIMSTFLRFLPAPIQELVIRHTYIPVAPEFTNLTDTMNGYNGFSEYISAWAAFRALSREESDTSSVTAIIAEWDKTIATQAQDRNRDIGDCVSDVYQRSLYGLW